ncbi:hypothetical protein [Maridesulfovibrio sp.]|uniref:hypothetical protein n=1 Tax=Maridesulfovibrio sp. TaxID=2795000 RepID=UPI003BAAA7CA
MKKIVIIAVVFLLTVICVPQVLAGNVDPSGRDLKVYVENFLQGAMPNDALAAKIKAAGGTNSSGIYQFLCELEVSQALSVGYDVWDNRYNADAYYQEHFGKSDFIQLNVLNYCLKYSNTCSHWEWNANCLKNRLGN